MAKSEEAIMKGDWMTRPESIEYGLALETMKIFGDVTRKFNLEVDKAVQNFNDNSDRVQAALAAGKTEPNATTAAPATSVVSKKVADTLPVPVVTNAGHGNGVPNNVVAKSVSPVAELAAGLATTSPFRKVGESNGGAVPKMPPGIHPPALPAKNPIEVQHPKAVSSNPFHDMPGDNNNNGKFLLSSQFL